MRSLTPPPLRGTFDGGQRETLANLLREMAKQSATELHLKTPSPVMIRVAGALRPISSRALGPSDVLELGHQISALAGRELAFHDLSEWEIGFGVQGVGRFRAQIYRQRGTVAILINRVETQPPKLAELNAPHEIGQLIGERGLTLFAGRSAVSWLHAAIDAYNHATSGFVLFAERPLAWLHRDERAVIAQREIGIDIPDHATAVRSGLALKADLIAIGDVPDPSAAEALLWAAEHGASIVAAIPAPSAEEARHWFVRGWTGEARREATERLDRHLVRTWITGGGS